MAKLRVRRAAFDGIGGTRYISRITNDMYDITSKAAEQRIEKNNREYAVTYKKASLYSAK